MVQGRIIERWPSSHSYSGSRLKALVEPDVDTGGEADQDLDMAGRVEAAVRAAVPGDLGFEYMVTVTSFR